MSKDKGKISLRLAFILSILTISGIIIASSVGMFFFTSRMKTEAFSLKDAVRSVRIAEQLKGAVLEYDRSGIIYSITGEKNLLRNQEQNMEEIRRLLKEAAIVEANSEAEIIVRKIKSEVNDYFKKRREWVKSDITPGQFLTLTRPYLRDLLFNISKLTVSDVKQSEMAIGQIENWYGTALGFNWIILIVFIAIMIFLIFFVKQYLLEPIKQIENYLTALIEERKETAIPPQKSSETESVVKSLKRLTGHVKEEGKRRIFHTAGVAHDLRSPLSALLSNLELARLKIGKEDDKQIGENIESAQRQVEKVNVLIDQFIEASKIQSGEFTLKIQDCDLKGLAEDSIKQLKEIHPERKFELKGEKVNVKCDCQRIEQVLNNLTANAIKYSKPRPPC